MEYRIVLTDKEAFELSSRLTFLSTVYVRDKYTGQKRIRTDESGETEEKAYETPVKGVIHRFSSKCELENIEDIWFEIKWTKSKKRFEIEFEGKVPDEFKGRENIRGWYILK